MALTIEQIKELVRDRPHKKEIDRGRVHQNRLRFHTETEITKAELSPYYSEFIGWICTEQPELLPKDKVARFKQLLTCPLSTIQLTESISINLSRVFEGQDKFDRYDFENDEAEKDWENYKDTEFWETEGFQAMINAIDSVWVVDLPAEQTGEKPEPKNLLIDISNVIDISCTPKGDCNYVIFSLNDKLFVYDDELISVYGYNDKEIIILPDSVPFKHELGYCPARMFWSDFLKKGNYINRKSPFTKVLSDLDWLLVHRTFKKWMDIANSFPITVMYETGNNYEDTTREENTGRGESQNKTLGGALVGPGTIFEVPRPLEGQPDLMANPVKQVTPDIATLEFHVAEDGRLTDYIFKTVVGVDGEQKNDQAKNEKQVIASFENQSIILKRIAKNFEIIQAFAEGTIIKLRYGTNAINDISIDKGTKFFLKTVEDLVAEKEAVAGDDIMTDAVSKDLDETRFRNDSAGKIRAQVIRDLDPLPGKSFDEVIQIKNAGGIDDVTFKIKAKLMYLVNRFEREQVSIPAYMKGNNDYSKRINDILSEFKKYIQEDTPVKKEKSPDEDKNPEKEKSGKVELILEK